MALIVAIRAPGFNYLQIEVSLSRRKHGFKSRRGRQPCQPLANPLRNFVRPLTSDKPPCLVFLRFCRAANSQLGSARLAWFA